MAGASRRRFHVLKGISWGPNGEHCYEPGDIAMDLPASDVQWMEREGIIREEVREESPAPSHKTGGKA